jgi:putative tricarboxylic transport membrane protein
MQPLARNGDFWSGLALAALGAYVVSQAMQWAYMTEDGPGAGFFPMWYGSIMVVLSLMLVGRSALRRPAAREAAPFRWHELSRAFVCWVAFVACIALMNVLGFTVSFALLTWFIIVFMAGRPQRVAIPVAVGFGALFYLIFVVGLELTLPSGYLF